MKILIISANPWSNDNSFGNTFNNLFEGMAGVELYDICCGTGQFDSGCILKGAVQMTDRSVLRSIYSKIDPCWFVDFSGSHKNDLNKEVSVKAKKKRSLFAFIIRDMIWKLGRWKKSKNLRSFLSVTDFDMIYLPIFSSKHMCDVQDYFIRKLNVPVVGHISDDVYRMYLSKKNLFSTMYKSGQKKKLRKLIDKCAYLEVFAENMAEEYATLFGKKCYLIGKGVNDDEVKYVDYNLPDGELKFVYTGNLGADRYKVLVAIGQALDNLCEKKKARLEIYSATELTKDMTKGLASCRSIEFKGKIDSEQVKKVQRDADILVHVEAFSEETFISTHMSFSTKIIDYMVMGKPIFAVGPGKVNSIMVLKNKQLAIVADSLSKISDALHSLYDNDIDLKKISRNVFDYLRNERDIVKINKGMKERMETLVKEKTEWEERV